MSECNESFQQIQQLQEENQKLRQQLEEQMARERAERANAP